MITAPRRYVRTLAAVLAVAILVFLFWRSPIGEDAADASLSRFMTHGQNPGISVKKSSFDWAKVEHKYLPPEEMTPLPTGQGKPLPRVQFAFGQESQEAARVRQSRLNEVRRIFQEDWKNYREFAWGKDALLPISGGSRAQFSGWAATLVDALDTLWIMGLRDEFEEAIAAVAEVDFGQSSSPRVNVFETTIRYLGGLLSAYDLSKRDVLLAKAVELGDLLYSAFNTPNRLPVDFMNFHAAKDGQGLSIESWVVSASPGTLSMEMTRLSQLTGDSKYYDAVDRLMRLFQRHQNTTHLPGLWPIWVSMKDENLDSRREFTLGGSADSLYEYLPKMYALLGGLEPMYKSMTEFFLSTATKYLFFRPMLPGGEDILVSGNVEVQRDGSTPLDPESEHLACFIGGTVALAGKLLANPEYVETGAKLAKGCAFAYNSFPSGVMPERYNMVPCEPHIADTCPWDEKRWEEGTKARPQYKSHLPKGFTTAKDPRYLLRPEAIESIFLLYRMTGDTEYQDIAWKMFKSVEAASRTQHGHASILDVTKVTDEQNQDSNLEDYMEVCFPAITAPAALRVLMLCRASGLQKR